MINKDLVKNSFEKNLKTYDDNAVVQKIMAENLVKMLPDKPYDKVLEIGIGTGFFTKLLADRIEYKEFFANDIVSECSKYLSQVIKGAVFVSGDIEDVIIPEKLDLVISNATLQWVSDLGEIFSKLESSMDDGGVFVFSTFGEKNFFELKEVAGVGLNYLSFNELKTLLEKHFEIVEIREEEEKVYFKRFKDILKHIKLTGVNGVSGKRYSITELKELEGKYSAKFKQGKCFELTYNPIYVSVKKKV